MLDWRTASPVSQVVGIIGQKKRFANAIMRPILWLNCISPSERGRPPEPESLILHLWRYCSRSLMFSVWNNCAQATRAYCCRYYWLMVICAAARSFIVSGFVDSATLEDLEMLRGEAGSGRWYRWTELNWLAALEWFLCFDVINASRCCSADE